VSVAEGNLITEENRAKLALIVEMAREGFADLNLEVDPDVRNWPQATVGGCPLLRRCQGKADIRRTDRI
jgi:hypothetical protein